MLIYTKPRSELKLVKKLEELQYTVYCPTRKTIRQWSDRKKKIAEPLFKSYVFIYIKPAQMQDITWVPGFSRFVYWLGKPVVVRDEEIEATRQFIDKVAHDTIAIKRFDVGQNVKVSVGPLKNVEGKILRISKKKAQLQIDSLGTVMSAELALSDLTA